jgi:hypothetical protein
MKQLSLQQFLKKYSNINNDFIDDFYNIYKPPNNSDNINSDFIINLELVSKWLNTKKTKLKETLIRTYVKNIDYIVNKNKNKNNITGSGGHNKVNVLLTSDCFTPLHI